MFIKIFNYNYYVQLPIFTHVYYKLYELSMIFELTLYHRTYVSYNAIMCNIKQMLVAVLPGATLHY